MLPSYIMISETMPADNSSMSDISETEVDVAPPHSSRIFQVNKKAFRHFYTINSASDKPLFYVDLSAFTPNKPELTLHAGTTPNTPVTGVCHMLKFSGDFKIGLGDPARPDAVLWEDLTKEKTVSAAKYRWETSVTGATSGGGGGPRALLWKRTRKVGVDDVSVSSLSRRNHKLVDERTGELLAVFTSDRSLSKCGKLQINVDYGVNFDRMVFITCLSLYEKARRRSHRGNGGGGGGG